LKITSRESGICGVFGTSAMAIPAATSPTL
jgi:hypothetical protein